MVLSIVCVEDDPDDFELVRLMLKKAGVEAELARVDTAAGLISSLTSVPDVVLCDYILQDFSAERALALLAAGGRQVPLVILTRAIGEDAVVKLFRAGAKDYVGKAKLALLPAVIERVLQEREVDLERQLTIEALAKANARMKVLSAHMVDTQERERMHIARELHDGLGQALTGIVVQLHAAHRSRSPIQAERCCADALGLAQQAIRQVKSMSFQLRPAQLELLGFVAAVEAMLDRQRALGLDVALHLLGAEPKHVGVAHAVALQILQEALTNVQRHAEASRLTVRLRFGPKDRFTVTLGDDGRGFEARPMLTGAIGEHNVGLHGMIERAELMDGRLRFRSSVGRGVVMRLSL